MSGPMRAGVPPIHDNRWNSLTSEFSRGRRAVRLAHTHGRQRKRRSQTGHAYAKPAPPAVLREPIGRIMIALSELRDHRFPTNDANEVRRAVKRWVDTWF